MHSTGWGAGGFGLAGYRQPQDQAVYGLNGAGRRRGRPLRGYAKAFCRGGYQPPAAPAPGQRADVGKPPRIPIASPLTFSPLWDRIMGHDRPDGASTVHTAGTERAPSAESAHGKADGRRPYQRARRRARSPSRTRRTRGSVPLRTWVAPRRQALSSRDKGRERLFAGKRPQKGACRGDYQSPAVSFPIPRAHTQVRPYGKPDPPGIPFPIFRRRGVQRPPPTALFVGAGVPDGPPSPPPAKTNIIFIQKRGILLPN